MNHVSKFAAVAAALAAGLALVQPLRAEEKTIELTLSDTAFDPAEIKVPAGQPFTLNVHNKSSAAAEIEAKDLRIEKVVAAGADIVIKVKAQEPGTYLFVNEYKEDTVFGHITAE